KSDRAYRGAPAEEPTHSSGLLPKPDRVRQAAGQAAWFRFPVTPSSVFAKFDWACRSVLFFYGQDKLCRQIGQISRICIEQVNNDGGGFCWSNGLQCGHFFLKKVREFLDSRLALLADSGSNVVRRLHRGERISWRLQSHFHGYDDSI